MLWDKLVDVVTIVWLFFFVLGFFSPSLESLCSVINLGLLPIFIADLVVRYKRVGSVKRFLRYHWFDILITIPYFRFLRALRILRAIRAARILKASRTLKSGKAIIAAKTTLYALRKVGKLVKAIKKVKRVMKYIAKH